MSSSSLVIFLSHSHPAGLACLPSALHSPDSPDKRPAGPQTDLPLPLLSPQPQLGTGSINTWTHPPAKGPSPSLKAFPPDPGAYWQGTEEAGGGRTAWSGGRWEQSDENRQERTQSGTQGALGKVQLFSTSRRLWTKSYLAQALKIVSPHTNTVILLTGPTCR